jgi:hypothetical protein
VRHGGDREHRDEHQPDGVERDRAQIGAQVAQRGEERRPVEERREEDQQDQVGWQLDLRDAGYEPDPKPADHEQDRVGHIEDAGENRETRDRHEQTEDDKFEVLHALGESRRSSPSRLISDLEESER